MSNEIFIIWKRKTADEKRKTAFNFFHCLQALHDIGLTARSFSWESVVLASGSEPVLNVSAEGLLTEQGRLRNLHDYAALIYCLECQCPDADNMGYDAGRKIRDEVLREIVLTLCGRNDSIAPLLKKLGRCYHGEEDFFDGYVTVDEKEGLDAYRKEQAGRAIRTGMYSPVKPYRKSWCRNWGKYFLIALLSSVFGNLPTST